MEFTAHVVLAFLTSLGTKDERMAACMDHMFVPVIHGGLSTLLGLCIKNFRIAVQFKCLCSFHISRSILVFSSIDEFATAVRRINGGK